MTHHANTVAFSVFFPSSLRGIDCAHPGLQFFSLNSKNKRRAAILVSPAANDENRWIYVQWLDSCVQNYLGDFAVSYLIFGLFEYVKNGNFITVKIWCHECEWWTGNYISKTFSIFEFFYDMNNLIWFKKDLSFPYKCHTSVLIHYSESTPVCHITTY